LAVDLASEFPCDMSKIQLVLKIAAESRALVESLNSPIKQAYVDAALVGSYSRMGNIYTSTASRSQNA